MMGVALISATGCGREGAPPAPVAAGQIPAELRRVFDQARPELKDAAGRISAALEAKDYAAAYQEAQELCALPEETPEQRTAGARVLLGVTVLAQTAAAQGDAQAAAALKLHRTSR